MALGIRIKILNKEEKDFLYGIPKLNNAERRFLFNLTESDYKDLETIPKVDVKINYILQLGYYRAKNFFFTFTPQQVRDDTWYIINNYFPGVPYPKKKITDHHYYKNQKLILRRFNQRIATKGDKSKLRQYGKKLAKRHVYPRFIFDELLSYCQQNGIIRPFYSTLQDMVSDSLKVERKRMMNKMSSLLTPKIRGALDDLLKSDDTFYRLTLLKKDPKDFSTSEMKKEVSKQKDLVNVYQHSREIFPKLNISAKNIEYYADMARYYTVAKLDRFDKNSARLYLLCYVHQRLFKVNDHLLSFITYRINKFYKDSEQYAKDQLSRKDDEAMQQLDKAEKLIRLYSNKKIEADELRPNAFKIVPEEQINQFAKDLTAAETKKEKFMWEYLEEKSKAIKVNIRPAFLAVQFSCDNEQFKEAMEFLKTEIINQKYKKYHPVNSVPMSFIPKKFRKHVIEKFNDPSDKRRKISKVNINRYEYMVYLQLEKQISSGQVFVKDSISYRKLEDELIAIEIWEKNKNKILKDLNIPLLNKPIRKTLKKLQEILDEQYHGVNKRIESGENTHIKIEKGKDKEVTWTLPYKKQEDAVNNPFYENFPNVQITDLIHAMQMTGGQLTITLNQIQIESIPLRVI